MVWSSPSFHTEGMPKRDRFLRAALFTNAAFSTLCSTVLFVDAEPLSTHLGAPPSVLYGLGAALAAFVMILVWEATRPVVGLLSALLISGSDFLWVLGSGLLVAMAPEAFTSLGLALVIGVAVVVGLSGIAQLVGIRRTIAETDSTLGTRCHIEVGIDADVSRDAMWRVVSDLEGVHRYAPDLAESKLRGGGAPGVNAVRQCTNVKGQTWAERCTRWDPGHGLDIEFQTAEAGFPFPMETMVGGWRLESLGSSRTRVTVWWSFTTKPSWAELMIVPILATSLRRHFPNVLRTMATEARGQTAFEPQAVPA